MTVVIDLWITNKIIVCVSTEIIEEYLTVILRPQFKPLGLAKQRYERIAKLIELENTKIVCPTHKLNIIKKDPDDNIFLESPWNPLKGSFFYPQGVREYVNCSTPPFL